MADFKWRITFTSSIPPYGRIVEFGIAPAHINGFTLDQCEEILGTPFEIKCFEKYMRGQTVAWDDSLGEIVYPHDLANYFLGLPVLD